MVVLPGRAGAQTLETQRVVWDLPVPLATISPMHGIPRQCLFPHGWYEACGDQWVLWWVQCGKPSSFFKIHHGGYDLDLVACGITLVGSSTHSDIESRMPADLQSRHFVRNSLPAHSKVTGCMRS